ncbi:type VI secretion system Vgr family protein [Polyangium mundeleinium]|uniref:Type VI secretion system tip protein TssI/VgrG n=1 Tax=Polyangium mundeleinium TaxID=2995306 RepID=A0ABT5EIT5_9BACT|nr:type VI secretion system tip protein TssI/VgrG [Polyangium mundeleinium]MDC0740847.1 type VI secretion system tip protein TssI/VgrG [Polyangium mundeleinium]
MKFGLDSIQAGVGAARVVADVIEKIRAFLGGAHPDFTFAREGAGWDELLVVRFVGREAISTPYTYEIHLLHRAHGGLDPHELLGARASLRVATLTAPGYRIVHGIITETEELATVPEGQLYRVVLEPPLALAARRTQSRVFVDKTLRQIIDAVLAPFFLRSDGAHAKGDDEHPDAYTPAGARYCYRITDTTRLDDRAARSYCVQYDESDFAFLSRLLEEEGIAYHFEHGPGTCVLVLSDGDEGKTKLDPFGSLGPGVHGRDVTAIKLGGRLRERAVKLSDYDWRKPSVAMQAEAGRDAALFEHRYPGVFHERPALGAPLVQARLDRLAVEAAYATGSGGVRVLSACSIFHLDHDGTHHDGQYLVTRLELRAEQSGVISQASDHNPEPFKATFELVRRGKGSRVEPSRFRPARVTPKPRVMGSQTAFVTDEPSTRGAEVNVGADIGCVRLRFHWDEDSDRHAKEATSCWVRVSQLSAGAGRGALFHPRVGDEVVVHFVDGDPDRPLVSGSVYNGQNLPPADAKGAASVSTIKSLATPGGGVKNEFAFDDTQGRERMSLHACRDMATHAGNDRAETVTNNASSRVGVDRSESTGANRSTDVSGNNAEHVGGNETIAVDANQAMTIGVNQSISVGADRSVAVAANESKTVGAAQSLAVSASRSITVGADQARNVGGSMSDTIGGSATLAVAGSRVLTVGADQAANIGGSYGGSISGSATQTIGGALGVQVGASTEAAVGADVALATGAGFTVSAGGAMSLVAQGEGGMQAPSIAIVALAELLLCVGGSSIRMTAGSIEIAAPCVKVSGGVTDVVGGALKLN